MLIDRESHNALLEAASVPASAKFRAVRPTELPRPGRSTEGQHPSLKQEARCAHRSLPHCPFYGKAIDAQQVKSGSLCWTKNGTEPQFQSLKLERTEVKRELRL